MKILLTARDAGAARQNLAFVENCIREGRDLNCLAMVEGPAAQIFAGSTIRAQIFDLSTEGAEAACREDIFGLIEAFDPHFAMLGLSYSGRGIDELVLDICLTQGIKNGVIQDYWGYLGQFSGHLLPDFFFVFDSEAERLTRLNAKKSVNCIISGSPKHEAYRYQLKRWCEVDPLKCEAQKSLVFIGQPSEVGGVVENFSVFVNALADIDAPLKLFFKPHPSDADHLHLYREHMLAQGHPFEIISGPVDVESVMFFADVVVTCFSTSGFDYNYLQFYSERTLGELVYLITGEDILASIEEVVGEPQIPCAKAGMGDICRTKEEFQTLIRRYIAGESSNYHEAVRSCLGEIGDPTAGIYHFIKALY